MLWIITKGDVIRQAIKLARLKQCRAFSRIEIVPHKTMAVYRRILAGADVESSRFLMIGDAFTQDILPVLRLGGRAAHVPAGRWSLLRPLEGFVPARRYESAVPCSMLRHAAWRRNEERRNDYRTCRIAGRSSTWARGLHGGFDQCNLDRGALATITSEIADFVKVGGLGDVSAALPRRRVSTTTSACSASDRSTPTTVRPCTCCCIRVSSSATAALTSMGTAKIGPTAISVSAVSGWSPPGSPAAKATQTGRPSVHASDWPAALALACLA